MHMNAFSDHDLQSVLKAEIQNCEGSSNSQLSNERAENLDYYFGRPFGNEVEGRSSVVSTDVRDTIEWIMPSLIRIFCSGERVVEFEPQGPEDVKMARLATDYVNFIWNRDNRGFLNFYSWFKDALLSKNGVMKIWWEERTETKRERYAGLDDMVFSLLLGDDSVEILEHETVPGTMGEGDRHDCTIARKIRAGRVCVHPVPPEEFLISRDARSIEEARVVAHRCRRTLSSLIEEGYDPALVGRLSGDDVDASHDEEEMARDTVGESDGFETTSSNNAAMRRVWVTECYLKLDCDGDGMAEMRKITVAGSGYDILLNEAWDAPRPFAALTPIIMPHRFYGLSVADLIKDIQLIKSTLWRQYLDNLYLQNNQREEVLESAIVDKAEVLSSVPGQKIRVRQLGAVNPIAVPPVGQFALEGLAYADTVRETRTGVSERTQGLASTQLHKTLGGERMLMSAAMGKIELIARVFAETGVRDAFRLILRLVGLYQDQERMIRLTNEWVPVAPSEWNPEMDVVINVGLGTGDKDQHLAHAMALCGLQEKAFALGLVTPDNFIATAEIIINAMGFKGVERFFSKPATEPPTAGGHAAAPIRS